MSDRNTWSVAPIDPTVNRMDLMPDYTANQKKIIERYYDHRDAIMLEKLSELVGELYLAADDKARDRLWKRVALAMKNLKVKQSLVDHILTQHKPEVLAAHLQDWVRQLPRG